MEKEIVWFKVAVKDFWEIVIYLKENWQPEVFEKFTKSLDLKLELLKKQPNLGFKSAKYSKFRKTYITQHYSIIYSVRRNHIVIFRLKHSAME